MNAEFFIKVKIEDGKVNTTFHSEKNDDIDISLLSGILKVFMDTQNKVKTQVAKHKCMQQDIEGGITSPTTDIEEKIEEARKE